MPFNGSGLFNRIFNWQQDRDAGIKILADRMDQEMDGFATGLSNTITRDGQSTISANIPFNNRKITGLGNATDPGDALNRATGDARYILDDDDTVKTANIEDDAVTEPKIADDAVTLVKLAADARAAANHTIEDISALNLDPADLNVQKAIEATVALSGPQARVDVASATTTNIGAASSQYVRITGTTTIEAFDDVPAGVTREVLFDASLTIEHDAASLILLGGKDIVTTAGDVALFRSEGSGNWRCVRYSPVGVSPETVVNGTAKAWINFDGTGTTNRVSFNVSSRTNVATGDYAINFTNAMPDANYALSGVTTIEAGNIGVVTSRQDASTFNRTTTSFVLGVRNTVSGFATNKPDISVSVSR